MPKKKIATDTKTWLFRVASKAENGGGHIARSLVLAKAWEEQVIFCLDKDSPYKALVHKEGFDVITVGEEAHNYKGIFLDVYSTENFEFYRSKTQCLMIIEGFKDFYDRADIYLRPPFGEYISRSALILSGLSYSLIGQQYQKITKDVTKGIDEITIAMGRYDSPNTTLFILECLQSFKENFHTNVVLGGRALNLASVKEFLETQYGKPYSLSIDLPGLADLYQRTDLLISSGAGSTLEACAMGIPTVVMSFAEDQILASQYLQEKGMVQYVGHYPLVSTADLEQTIKNAFQSENRRSMIANMDILDTNGPQRIYEAVCKYLDAEGAAV